MEKYQVIIFFLAPILIGLILNKLLVKEKLLLNYTGYLHQKFTNNKSVPLMGGIIFIIFLVFINFSITKHFFFFLFIFFLIGFLADTNFLKSAKLRLILQIIFLLLFINIDKISIVNVRIEFIDVFLNNKNINIFFTAICLLILINGTNFIDGCNSLVVGYFLSIAIILKDLNLINFIFNDINHFYSFLFLIISIFLLNFYEKLFLGDSGVYILSIIFGTILIKAYELNPHISPYFICILLWYPAFEVLFSITRKFSFNKSILKPDTNHFHQLLYFFISKRTQLFNGKIKNSLTGVVINIYNLLIFMISSNFFLNSEILIFIIFFNITLYSFIYIRLYKYKLKYLS